MQTFGSYLTENRADARCTNHSLSAWGIQSLLDATARLKTRTPHCVGSNFTENTSNPHNLIPVERQTSCEIGASAFGMRISDYTSHYLEDYERERERERKLGG
jgi:hypothetical protein